eukprot:SAG31_NODE_115_length_24128_cov_47.693912_11_plen_1303_part_00
MDIAALAAFDIDPALKQFIGSMYEEFQAELAEERRKNEAQEHENQLLAGQVVGLQAMLHEFSNQTKARLDQCETATHPFIQEMNRRRIQEDTLCRGSGLAAMFQACCPSSGGNGGGHRRFLQSQGCDVLPDTCPSDCAPLFIEFFEGCQSMIDDLTMAEQQEFAGLYADCSEEEQQSAMANLQPVDVKMFRITINQEAEQQAAMANSGPAAPSPGEATAVEQYHAQCTTANILTCVPACNATHHGFVLLATIDGTDTKFSCTLANQLFSWVGAAALGGFLGQNVAAFVSAVISGAAGTYVLTLTEDAGVGTDLVIQPGQHAMISGDTLDWGAGGYNIQRSAILQIKGVQIHGSIRVRGGDLILDNVVASGGMVVTGYGTVKFNRVLFSSDGYAYIQSCREVQLVHMSLNHVSVSGIAIEKVNSLHMEDVSYSFGADSTGTVEELTQTATSDGAVLVAPPNAFSPFSVAPECNDYQLLENGFRRTTTINRGAGLPHEQGGFDATDDCVLVSDSESAAGGAWFRFTGAAGNALVTETPNPNHCGTAQTGWLSGWDFLDASGPGNHFDAPGTYPTLSDGAVDRLVCFDAGWANANDNGSPCWQHVQVKVRNCGSYFVWKLPNSPACTAAYCTVSNAELLESGATTNLLSLASAELFALSEDDSTGRRQLEELPSDNGPALMKSIDNMLTEVQELENQLHAVGNETTTLQNKSHVVEAKVEQVQKEKETSRNKNQTETEIELQQENALKVHGLQSALLELASRMKRDILNITLRLDQHETDTHSFVKEVQALHRRHLQEEETLCRGTGMIAMFNECCPRDGGHRRFMQTVQGCDTLPGTCSSSCAPLFIEYFEGCQGIIDDLAPDQRQMFVGFYGGCQEVEQAAAAMLEDARPAMIFHVVVMSEAEAQEAQMFGGGGTLAPPVGPIGPLPPSPSPAGGAEIAQEFRRVCTTANLTVCVPQCNRLTYGFLLSIEIDGRGTVMTCNKMGTLFSWQGQAALGGYIGDDFQAFFSSVVSGAAGTYLVTLRMDAGISTDLTIQPGQAVVVNGDLEGLGVAPRWGVGGFAVEQFGSLALSRVRLAGALSIAGGGSLALSGCDLAASISSIVVTRGGSLSLASLALPAQSLGTAMLGLSEASSRLQLESVTVVEHPEWGALTGSVTKAEAGLEFDPPNFVPAVFFVVLSGPCTVDEGGRCVGRWPGGYGPDEDCEIVVAGGGVLGDCPVFDTEGGLDYLTLPSGRYRLHNSQYAGDECPARQELAAGQILAWHSNSDNQGGSPGYNQHGWLNGNGLPHSVHGLGGGWQVCFGQ